MTPAAKVTITAIVRVRRPLNPRARTLATARSINRGRPQAVAGRAHGLDRRRAAGKRQLAAQVADVDAEDVRARVVGVAPHRREDPLARENLVGVACEERQKLELGRREADLGAGAPDAPAQEIDLEVTG